MTRVRRLKTALSTDVKKSIYRHVVSAAATGWNSKTTRNETRGDEMSLLPRTRTALLRHTRMFRESRHIRDLECALLASLTRPAPNHDKTGGAVARLLRLETRIKTPSSIWYKLMRKGLLPCVSMDILGCSLPELQRIDKEIASIIADDFIDLIFTGEVLDIVGTRVFVENEADCYAARDQLIAARPPFRFVGERSKDYIRCDSNNNGYQSCIKTHFITIDTSTLYGLLTELNVIPSDKNAFQTMKEHHWMSTFRIQRLEGKPLPGSST